MSPTPEFEPTAQTSDKSGTINRPIYTVTELNEAARKVLEKGLGMVSVAGEISNLARPASGHIYFSLKDGGAQVRCAMFRNRARRLDFNPDNGLGVLVRGRVSLYTTRGDYQLVIDSIEAEGAGLLRLQFEQLKTRLLEEGTVRAGIQTRYTCLASGCRHRHFAKWGCGARHRDSTKTPLPEHSGDHLPDTRAGTWGGDGNCANDCLREPARGMRRADCRSRRWVTRRLVVI